jgi:DnaK suppressor protein
MQPQLFGTCAFSGALIPSTSSDSGFGISIATTRLYSGEDLMEYAIQTQTIQYEHHRTKLERERTELQQAIRGAEEQLKQVSEQEVSEDLEVGRTSARELLLERASRCRHQLKIVVQCLERIYDGTFGLCIGCENPIGERRLQALPSARYCITCQEQLEREQAIRTSAAWRLPA